MSNDCFAPRATRPLLAGALTPMRLLPALAVTGLAAPALAGPALARPVVGDATPATLLVSTSGDPGAVTASGPLLDDASLVRVRASEEPLAWFLDGHWRAVAGFAPGDVDGLARRPGAGEYTAAGLAFSLLSNEQGFLDGDVLGLAPGGGIEVLVTEEQVAAALGVPGVGIDLDAIAFDGEGRLVFSLQSDLAGSSLGDLSNGDVLRLEIAGGASRLATEADVEAALELATALSVGVGDVHGVDVVDGELWVSIQSPGQVDGGVLALGANARMVADEAELGLGGEELDALVNVPSGDDPLAIWIDAPGAEGLGACTAGTPFGVGFLVVSGASGYEAAPYLADFGAWYVDPLDALLTQQLASGAGALLFDGTGGFQAPFTSPGLGGGPGWDGVEGWTFQIFDATTLRLSAPYRRDI